ncbi:MAG: ATP-binding cassette, subfamily er 3 [Solirubrobacteraceae bacterium]|nr:ATP-binding cassette, subfamily er 3 [Solirubrobacteraceae bacterium]
MLIASDLAKDVAGAPLFRGVSFNLGRGERLTLAGRNGSGKTTLLRVLAGQAPADGGELSLAKGTRIALHDQRPPRERDLALRDYVLSGCGELQALEDELRRLEQAMADGATDERTFARYAAAQARLEHAGGYGWRERALQQAHGLGFGDERFDQKITTLSGGELTRASLARALATDADVLLLDEPTNHLDIGSLEWLEQTLVGLDAAIVLVAHDRWFLEAVGTCVLELEAGRGRFFAGPWHAWRKEQAQRELALGRAVARQEAEIARLERFVARFSAGTRSRQAQARVKKLDKLDRIEQAPQDGPSLSFKFADAERTGRVIFELEGGEVAIGGRTLLRDAELWLERGEHVALVGSNGAGKTTLINTLLGRRELAGGKLRRGHNVQLALLSQHAEELGTKGTALSAAQEGAKLSPNRARALLGRFLFSGEDAEKSLATMSGGERQRLALALLVSSGANVLVLDEPTNHLDVESREALEDALREFNGALLLVTHDRALLDAVGSRTVAIEEGTLHTYEGGWADYLRLREARRAREEAAAAPARELPRRSGNGAQAERDGAKPKGPSKNAIRHREQLERDIAAAEAALAALEKELADPAAWADPERSAASTERHQAAKRRVEELYDRLTAAER